MTRLTRAVLALVLLTTLTGAWSRGCAPEAGTAPNGGPPGTHTYRFVAEGTPRRAHIYLKVGSFVHIDDTRNLPWDKKNVKVQPHQFVTFTVQVIDVLNPRDVVTCKIENAAGEEVDRDGPLVVAKCALSALKQDT